MNIISVHPSEWDNVVPTGQIFMKFYTGDLHLKNVEKCQGLLKVGKNIRHFM
jgi:hypothetical protein